MVSRTAHFHFQKFCNSKVRVVKKIILLKDKMMHQLGCIKTLLQESEACDLSTGTGIQQLIASPGITCSFFQHGLPFPVRSCDPKKHHPKHLANSKCKTRCTASSESSRRVTNPRFLGVWWMNHRGWNQFERPIDFLPTPKHHTQKPRKKR